jgi:hypothetical protein
MATALFTSYPASLDIEYPDRELNRLTSFFRPLMALPVMILLGLLCGTTIRAGDSDYWLGTGGILSGATALMLLFRRKYPVWWFDWNVELTRFSTRVMAFLALLTDEYPSVEYEQAVHIDISYPDAATELNRWLPLVKWLPAIPHWIVLGVLSLAATICVILAWFAILVTGSYPRPLFDFVVGVFRWWLRVSAYALLLTTDQYPPFSLQP